MCWRASGVNLLDCCFSRKSRSKRFKITVQTKLSKENWEKGFVLCTGAHVVFVCCVWDVACVCVMCAWCVSLLCLCVFVCCVQCVWYVCVCVSVCGCGCGCEGNVAYTTGCHNSGILTNFGLIFASFDHISAWSRLLLFLVTNALAAVLFFKKMHLFVCLF